MEDYIIRATAANAQIRAFAATTKNMVEAARVAHGTSHLATAALGRTMTAAAMMGSMMKGEKDLLTVQIKGDGPLEGVTVTADAQANVKGYVVCPKVELPLNSIGHLDVGGGIGNGILQVIKDMGLKEPYVGRSILQTGEIAEDFTYYFAVSEQVPSSVGLGVLVNPDDTVRQAGGFIVQLMPFATDEVIAKLEENIKNLKSVTTMLEEGNSPEQILEILLDGLDVEINDRIPTAFCCDCSRQRVEKAIISIGKKDIQEMIEDGKDIHVNCQFCRKDYTFTVEDLKEMIRYSK